MRRHSVVHVFTTRPPRASQLGWRHSPSLGHLAHPHSTAPRVATWLCTSSPLGRSARRLSVVHAFTTWPPRASQPGWTYSPSLGRPARRHSVGHLITTRPPRASPLGWSPHNHSAAPRVATRLVTSSPLGYPSYR